MRTDRPLILSIQVGKPRTLPGDGGPGRLGRSWSTGIFKEPVAGPVWVGRTNLASDGQADLRVHGGPDQAVLAYPADHYPAWRQELGTTEFGPGAFGENLTIAGVTEEEVCLDDIYAIGDAVLQVSQPRAPCWKLARRWERPDLPARVQHTARNGWYYRVLREGQVEPGDVVHLFDRPLPDWSVARLVRER